MASFSDIGVSQAAASTITMKLATITQTRNSTVTHQEIVTLGDPDSTNALMAVVATAPASTAWGAVVRIAGGPSSLADFAVRAVPPSTAADNPCVATIGTNLQSTAATNHDSSALNVRIVGGLSSLADALGTVRLAASSAADILVTATLGTNLQSTAAANSNSSAMNVRLIGGVSSNTDILGSVRSQPASTSWASSAGFHFDSSGFMQVAASFTGSTDVRVSAVATSTTAQNSSNYLPVRLTDGSSFLTPGSEYTDGSTASSFAGPILLYDNSSAGTMRKVGSTSPLPVVIRTSAGVEIAASTAVPAANAVGLPVYSIKPTLNSTRILVNIGTGGGSTTLVSSQAGLSIYVCGYAVTSTITNISSVAFLSSLGTAEQWGFMLGSQSSGVTGANLAVPTPAALFKTAANNPLGFSASSTGLYSVSVSWFTAA